MKFGLLYGPGKENFFSKQYFQFQWNHARSQLRTPLAYCIDSFMSTFQNETDLLGMHTHFDVA